MLNTYIYINHSCYENDIAREDFCITDYDVLKAIAFYTSLCENASQYQMALFIADKLDWSIGGHPPYYKQMSEALEISLEAACYEYVKYTESDGKMASIHADWAKAVRWLKSIYLQSYFEI